VPIRPRDDRDPSEIRAEKQAFFEAIQRAQADGTAPPEPPPSLRGGRVLLPGGVTLPSEFGDSFDDPDRGLRIEVDCEVEGTTPVCVALSAWRLDGSPLRRADLRDLPLEKYAAEAAEIHSFVMPPGTPIGMHVAEIHAPGRDPSFRRRHTVTDNDLRRVAAAYRAALERGDPPTVAVADDFVVSRASGGRLVRRARERGFLGPALKRKAGEAKKEKDA
jgi:hypothetical protein